MAGSSYLRSDEKEKQRETLENKNSHKIWAHKPVRSNETHEMIANSMGIRPFINFQNEQLPP